MNQEELSEAVKKDIEDQSLEILETIKDSIIVIGGWGVRAHLGKGHHRFTLDVDGVTDKTTLKGLHKVLASFGFKEEVVDWGIKFFKKYEPNVDINPDEKPLVDVVELRIEISPPRIQESSTPHYFDFSLTDYEAVEIRYHNRDGSIIARVPSIEDMAAVKLGLPVSYKHNYDAAMLLKNSDIENVIKSIRENDDWASLVLRRMPKLKGRIRERGRLDNKLAFNAGLNIKEHIKRLEYIESELKK